MARVLLILPHLPQPMGAPYVGQQYVAAALLARGHEVRCVDMAAVCWRGSSADVAVTVAEFNPHVIGYTVFTYNARAAYVLRESLGATDAVHVAGGPHTTIRPQEALHHGFDAAVIGEGELALPALVEAVVAGEWPCAIAGVQTAQGVTAGGFLEDLSTLPWPQLSYASYDERSYGEAALVASGGLMTSRGCPAKCTFCANYVTGRSFRWRNKQDVMAEMRGLHSRYGLLHFSFWDDAFTANRPRLRDLCAAMQQDPVLKKATWSCITPANMTNPEILKTMADAGCIAINFGIESGDATTLRGISKGQRPQQILRAVATAKSLGMNTIVNFMFGFPGETVEALTTTLRFMEELSAHTTWFNNRGVLVPFPGTPIYEKHHVAYDFTDWWLDPHYIEDELNPWTLDPQQMHQWLAHDPTLKLDFFNYSQPMREMIARCVRYKAEHNATTTARLQAATSTANPVD